MELGDGWMQVFEPDPLPFLLWIWDHSHLEWVFQTWNGHLMWPATLLLGVVDADPEWEAAEAEYGPNALETASHGGEEEILLVTDTEGEATEVSADESAQDEEATETSAEEDEQDDSISLSSNEW